MGKISRAEQAGRRLGETINESANLMYQRNTRKNFFKGLHTTIGKEFSCFSCLRKYSCKRYCKPGYVCDIYQGRNFIMPKLNFPKEDWRSSGKSFVENRPWIKQGAYLSIIIPKRRTNYYCPVVHFDDAPRHVTDIISNSYIKK